ncbi:MAG: ATP-binding cassette domain-containing protein [Nitrososphaeria archaeon]|nr:ATP-binding cassette domain-containing protein [Nitrososphaeria archaeon]
MVADEIISVENLSYTYMSGNSYALYDINLKIHRGEFVVIMGPSGCGKSTLLYTFNGIIPHLFRGKMSGRVIVDGIDTKQSSISKLSQIVGMVFQNPETQIVASTVIEEVAFGPENLNLSIEEIRARVEESLAISRLSGKRDFSTASLSGGEKQALAIASVLALKPKVLALDEPTSMLDPAGAALVSSIIGELNKKLGMTVIAVDHRVEWAVNVADRLIIMDEGKIVIDDKPSNVFKRFDLVRKIGFRPPQVTELFYKLRDNGFSVNDFPITVEEAEGLVRWVLDD